MEVSGSHGGAKQQQRVFVLVRSCRESLGAIGSHWESLGAVGVNFPTKVPGQAIDDAAVVFIDCSDARGVDARKLLLREVVHERRRGKRNQVAARRVQAGE